MKKYRLHHAAKIVLLTALLADAGCKSNNNKPTPQPVSAAKPSEAPPKRLVKKTGWEIPGLAGAKGIQAPRLLPAAGNAKVYLTTLAPQPKAKSPGQPLKTEDLPTIRTYLAEEQRKELGITAKKLYILTIVK